MEQKKLFSRLSQYFLLTLLGTCLFSHAIAEDEQAQTRSVQLNSSEEFTLVDQENTAFTIRPLKQKLRAIENLKNTEAVGITYLGKIILTESATPLSALRDISVQISTGLDIDLALITDSTTSQSLQPHEMLLLYHPSLVITLALTKVPESDEYSLMGTYAIPVSHTPGPESTESE